MTRTFCWLLFSSLHLVAAAQTLDPHYDVPPAVPPPSCGLTLAGLGSITGPPAYQRLAYQLKASASLHKARSPRSRPG